jgi:hypothetical protein
MKCVKSNLDNEVRRVSEDRAINLVNKGWKFVPKSEWKSQPNTTWTKSSTPPNPTSPEKLRRKVRNGRT